MNRGSVSVLLGGMLLSVCMILFNILGWGGKEKEKESEKPKKEYYVNLPDTLTITEGEVVTVRFTCSPDLYIDSVIWHDKEVKCFGKDTTHFFFIGCQAGVEDSIESYTIWMQGFGFSGYVRIEKNDTFIVRAKGVSDYEYERSSYLDSLEKINFSFVPISSPVFTDLFIMPLVQYKTTSPYGVIRKIFPDGSKRYHSGTDIAPLISGTKGVHVLSVNDGIVVATGFDPVYSGNFVIIDHGGGIISSYSHLEKILVEKGELVLRGETIGIMGETGNAQGIHLHFSLRVNMQLVDMEWFVENQKSLFGFMIKSKARYWERIDLFIKRPHLAFFYYIDCVIKYYNNVSKYRKKY
ncbi:M23 family metallopeptidase [Candidatus Nomurabacteria bacterium]|nr:M23 family metallopeptidase [Candidatus Nomurabacteria bacterium]